MSLLDLNSQTGKTMYQILLRYYNPEKAHKFIQVSLPDPEHVMYAVKQDHINRTIDMTVLSYASLEKVSKLFADSEDDNEAVRDFWKNTYSIYHVHTAASETTVPHYIDDGDQHYGLKAMRKAIK
jgi:hypothetical protein